MESRVTSTLELTGVHLSTQNPLGRGTFIRTFEGVIRFVRTFEGK